MSDTRPVPASLAAQREHTIAVLSDVFSRNLIELDELEARVDRAHCASSSQELEAILADLDLPATSRALVPQAASAVTVNPPEAARMIAVLGGVQRTGQWIVPRRLTVTAVLGGADLDLREAHFGPGVTEIHVRAVLGGVDIIVPPHVAVETHGIAVLGGFEEKHRAPPTPDPDRPLVRISGVAVLGGVDVSTKLPGKDRRRRRDSDVGALGDTPRRQLGSGDD